MSEPFIAQITMFGGNFAPRQWAFCDGQLLAISTNSALFSIVGTIYGGDGRTTFGLPDLRGRSPMHPGHGPGLPSVRLGDKFGNPNTTLTSANMPAHNHGATLNTRVEVGTKPRPGGNLFAVTSPDRHFAPPTSTAVNAPMAADAITVGNTGGNQSFSTQSPVQVVSFIIALVGVYPSRN